jgi:EpsD family peptidyl-prolyl cis-trans isomerase
MRAANPLLATVAALALLGACDKLPEGKQEVAARVYGEKITVPELEIEMKAAGVADVDDPQMRQAALQRIILRKVMAHAAHEQKLDQDKSYLVLKKAAVESYDASLAEKAAVEKVETPALQDAAAYVSAHPEIFAQRTIYLVDEIVVPQRPDQSLLDALKPVNELGAVEKILSDRRLPYRKAVNQIDTLRLNPQISLQLAKNPNEVFVLPAGNSFVVAHIRASKVQPVGGADANAIASAMLTSQRRQKAVADAADAAMDAAKSNVEYGPGFAPAAEPKK